MQVTVFYFAKPISRPKSQWTKPKVPLGLLLSLLRHYTRFHHRFRQRGFGHTLLFQAGDQFCDFGFCIQGGEILAQSLPDVGTDQGLVASKSLIWATRLRSEITSTGMRIVVD